MKQHGPSQLLLHHIELLQPVGDLNVVTIGGKSMKLLCVLLSGRPTGLTFHQQSSQTLRIMIILSYTGQYKWYLLPNFYSYSAKSNIRPIM